ncbi:MAG: citrate/2-methylcitrate synthase, partial [Candidatus Electryoneaceae bacterium]|nr:citrate/2-methylcitrate synthase [Candidatus Electryoneaceae bacterium]
MATLQERFAELVPQMRQEVGGLLKTVGGTKMSEVTVKQSYGGMRGVKGMICDTSVVEPDKGLIIRGRPLLTIKHLWPEEIFYLLCTGEEPTKEETAALQLDLASRSHVPEYVWDVLESMPADSHPMCMLNTAILVMEKESAFRAWYDKGMKKPDYWIPMMEDALRILGV